MQVRCIRAFGHHKPGDTEEIPDGAEASGLYWEPVEESSSARGKSAPGGSEVSSSPVLITPDGPRPAEAPKAGM